MRYHSQNLNESNGNAIGSMFWRGRAWFYSRQERRSEIFHIEWLFGKYARDFSVTAAFGYGDSDSGACLHLCIPWVFSVYLVFPHVFRCKESQTGIAIHNGSFWIYPLTDQTESRRDHPWWKKSYAFHFPWTYEHHLTEILEHKANLPGLAKTMWDDKGKKFMDSYDERKSVEKSVSETYDYAYTLKSGEVQHRKATVYADRMTWRMRWWPILPFSKSKTCISVDFNGEVGEGTGSWKGGTIGCGYEMNYGETPMQCLRRMESERKFDR